MKRQLHLNLFDGAADGFNIMPPLLPAQLEIFAARVTPLLQRRGLFRAAYEGAALRVPRPRSAFDGSPNR